MIIVTGDSPGIVIPDYLFSFTEIDHYQVLLAEIAEKYGLKVGTNKEIMKKEVNGDICNSFMAHMGILCFRVNIG